MTNIVRAYFHFLETHDSKGNVCAFVVILENSFLQIYRHLPDFLR